MLVINHDTNSRMGEGGRKDSNIDLVFESLNIYDIVKYEQLEDSWGSDRYPILFEIKTDRRIYKKKSNRISNKKTRWELYKDILKEKKIELKEEGYVKTEEKKYNKLIESMKEAV